jgi:glycosyltransferase involved in cell wall biosynthesis
MLQTNDPGTREGTAHARGVARRCAAATPGNQGLGQTPAQRQPTVSIIIKALNEERHIAMAIESSLAALGDIDGEVILADSGSTDRTVDIARRYPVLIVRLNRIEDRSCGAGPQLGFQYSRGQYLLLIDGDMQLYPGFIPAALETLRQNARLAGVGGAVYDREVDNEEYEQRLKRRDPDRRAGPVTRLNSSGLYRRTAIESIGYLTDRNLHGAEEFDLGARLHAAGWSLTKIDLPLVDHFPHKGSAYRLLWRRIFNRNAFALGELIRAAMGHRHFWFVIRKDHQLLLALLVTGWWITLVSIPLTLSGWRAAFAAAAVLLVPFAAMWMRWRSARLALYSVTAWNVFTFCSWLGLWRARKSPTRWIDSTVLQAPHLDDASRSTHGRDAGGLASLS